MIRTALTVLLSLGLLAPEAHGAPPGLQDELARGVTAAEVPGAVVVMRDGDETTVYTAGYADPDTRTVFTADTHVRAASITKTFVASTIMQLVAEDRIDLDTPVERYLSGRIGDASVDTRAITVRQLLRHQSGVPEYYQGDTPVPTSPVTAAQLLAMARGKPAQFPPGTAMHYTNTNYVLAGMIIEAVTGVPAAEEITRRIIEPLGLNDTYFPSPDDFGLRSPFARGYRLTDGRRTEVTTFNASAAGMAGSLISSNADLSMFLTALLDGGVVAEPELSEMMQTVEQPGAPPGQRYGLGLASIDLPCGVTVWGHGGDIDGYHSILVKPVDGQALSMTVTQEQRTENAQQDLRFRMVDDYYCPSSDQAAKSVRIARSPTNHH